MDVDIAVPMRMADFGCVDVRQPIVGDDLARDVEDQAAQRVALVGVGVDAPILLLQVFVDRGGDVDQRPAVGAQPLVAIAVDDAGGCEPGRTTSSGCGAKVTTTTGSRPPSAPSALKLAAPVSASSTARATTSSSRYPHHATFRIQYPQRGPPALPAKDR